MTFDFDTPIDRRGTASVKWDGLPEGAIAMCLADMDFPAPAAVTAAVRARADHGIYGYTGGPERLAWHIAAWAERRYGWVIKKSWIMMDVGVVASLASAVRALTAPGDRIIIQTPVYHPFFSVIRNNGRVVVENRLVLDDGYYHMDFDALAAQARDAAMLILCNPHNPVGRVWTREELSRVAEICLEHNVIIVSDDIHCDFAFARPYTPIASLGDAVAQTTVTCLAGSKTFNIAGLATSYLVIPNPELVAAMRAEQYRRGILHPNMFGSLALDAVYREGDAWLDALRAYLIVGQRILHDYLDPLPGVRLIAPEGTFLVWLDCRALGRPSDALVDELLWAGVRLTAGRVFGEAGEGFLRLNYGTSHATLREGLARLAGFVDQAASGPTQ